MNSFCRIRLGSLPGVRRMLSTKTKFNVQLDEATANVLQNEQMKHRKHSGVDTAGVISVPDNIVEAMTKALKEYPPKAVWNDGLKLTRYLRARHVPAEPSDIEDRRLQYEQEIIEKMQVDFSNMTAEEIDTNRKRIEGKVTKLLHQRIYSWKPIEYDAYKSLQYLLGRSAQEYSAILRIFTEIRQRVSEEEFQPQSFFDFGSGVGTGIWAASCLWRQSLFEYYLVDASRDMNDLADLILRGGDENRNMGLKNVNFRQFLPASYEDKYDIVLSAYSLLELPDAKTRLETLQTLWNKCDRFLVIVEQGTAAGFKIVSEARDFILYANRDTSNCHVFAPCPHDQTCPRISAADGTPCNFVSAHRSLPFGGQQQTHIVKYEPYSYVVLEKRPRNAEHVVGQWPRIVRPTLVRSKHAICRMCTARGKLDEIIFTPSKHEKHTYRCARSSKWGDRLPVQLEECTQTESTERNP